MTNGVWATNSSNSITFDFACSQEAIENVRASTQQQRFREIWRQNNFATVGPFGICHL
jgi:hypothetical protein